MNTTQSQAKPATNIENHQVTDIVLVKSQKTAVKKLHDNPQRECSALF